MTHVIAVVKSDGVASGVLKKIESQLATDERR
jgi:hypothetical protein